MRRSLLRFLVAVLVAGGAGAALAALWDPPCPKAPKTLKQWMRAVGREECLSAERACRELTYDRIAEGMNRSDRRILGIFTPPGGSDARALARLVAEFRQSYDCPEPDPSTWRERPGERLRLLILDGRFVLAGESGRIAELPADPRTLRPDVEGLAAAIARLGRSFPDERELTLFPGRRALLEVVLFADRLARSGDPARFEVTTVFCEGDPDEGGCPEWRKP